MRDVEVSLRFRFACRDDGDCVDDVWIFEGADEVSSFEVMVCVKYGKWTCTFLLMSPATGS